ncbi:MAG: Uma2 family endonuclease [Aphanothece sp. CMT-3BRIN-NPC111]|jgi:Uma2 family endonuclease|nr:Uma2 family endonuclease [Aphanothece sp. CMT-3BRIN-NPC111]
MQVKEQHYYTPEEYLQLETAATFRSEYYQGQIFPMAGGTPNHNRIALNLSTALNFALKRQPYDVFMSDMRLWIPRQRLYTYPDVMVVAGQLKYAEGRRDAITNPVAIAEVLSESTQKYDRVGKFKLYRAISTLREYILISQTEISVEQYSQTENNKWLFSEYESENAVLDMTSVPFQISLLDLYDKVEFESEPLPDTINQHNA